MQIRLPKSHAGVEILALVWSGEATDARQYRRNHILQSLGRNLGPVTLLVPVSASTFVENCSSTWTRQTSRRRMLLPGRSASRPRTSAMGKVRHSSALNLDL